jgi:hypothetical protein
MTSLIAAVAIATALTLLTMLIPGVFPALEALGQAFERSKDLRISRSAKKRSF